MLNVFKSDTKTGFFLHSVLQDEDTQLNWTVTLKWCYLMKTNKLRQFRKLVFYVMFYIKIKAKNMKIIIILAYSDCLVHIRVYIVGLLKLWPLIKSLTAFCAVIEIHSNMLFIARITTLMEMQCWCWHLDLFDVCESCSQSIFCFSSSSWKEKHAARFNEF